MKEPPADILIIPAVIDKGELQTMKKIIILLLLVPAALYAAPQAELWDVWTLYTPGSDLKVDHSTWDHILDRYLSADAESGINLFDYSGLAAGLASGTASVDEAALERYLVSLENIEVDRLDRDEQMAYWINFYNALTVKVITDNWPVESIRDINLGGGGLFAKGPWDAPLAEVQGRPVSLNDMEHRILRPIWKDPRIHYAVNCASLGCPNLQRTAFTGENLEALLESAAAAYINTPRGAEAEGRTLHLSSVYDWFSDDFGGSEEAVLRHIGAYADRNLKDDIKPFLEGKGRIRYRYDWNVNSAGR
jgi:hypothetical protein